MPILTIISIVILTFWFAYFGYLLAKAANANRYWGVMGGATIALSLVGLMAYFNE